MKKQPVTISLSQDVVETMDKAATNRSAYIEWLIRQDLKMGYKPVKKGE